MVLAFYRSGPSFKRHVADPKQAIQPCRSPMYYLVLLKGVLPDLDFTREQPKESELADRASRDPQILLGQPHGPSGSRVMQCGRRMFMSALMLAAKYLQDRNFSVKAWAKISGLSCTEINKNEKAYLQSIEYRLHLKKEHFDNWSQIVVELCQSTRTQRSLDFLKVIQRLKPDIIYDPENTKQFLKEIEQGNYHDAVSPTACRAQHFGIYCRDNKASISQFTHTPLNSLLKAGMSLAMKKYPLPGRSNLQRKHIPLSSATSRLHKHVHSHERTLWVSSLPRLLANRWSLLHLHQTRQWIQFSLTSLRSSRGLDRPRCPRQLLLLRNRISASRTKSHPILHLITARLLLVVTSLTLIV